MDMTGAAQDIQELVHAFAQVSLVIVLSPFHPRKTKKFKSPFPLCTILALLYATVINNKQIPFFACLLSNYCDYQQFFSGVGPRFFFILVL